MCWKYRASPSILACAPGALLHKWRIIRENDFAEVDNDVATRSITNPILDDLYHPIELSRQRILFLILRVV